MNTDMHSVRRHAVVGISSLSVQQSPKSFHCRAVWSGNERFDMLAVPIDTENGIDMDRVCRPGRIVTFSGGLKLQVPASMTINTGKLPKIVNRVLIGCLSRSGVIRSRSIRFVWSEGDGSSRTLFEMPMTLPDKRGATAVFGCMLERTSRWRWTVTNVSHFGAPKIESDGRRGALWFSVTAAGLR